jgi:hypothetical protein
MEFRIGAAIIGFVDSRIVSPENFQREISQPIDFSSGPVVGPGQLRQQARSFHSLSDRERESLKRLFKSSRNSVSALFGAQLLQQNWTKISQKQLKNFKSRKRRKPSKNEKGYLGLDPSNPPVSPLNPKKG